MTKKIIAKDNEHLYKLVRDEINIKGENCSLNHIDVSKITDMSNLLWYLEFNGDISKWDVSNVRTMTQMFANSNFNGDISQWNVSNVTQMQRMFSESKFNGDISKWNVSNVEYLQHMFQKSNFTRDLSLWTPYNLLQSHSMFDNCNAPKPYWFNFNNINDRNEAIKKFLLHQSLHLELGLHKNKKGKKKTKI